MHMNCLALFLAQAQAQTTAATPAAAATAAGATAAGGAPPAPAPSQMVMQFVPFILVFVVLYFLMIRPQNQRAKQLAKLLESLKPGDKVATSAGIVGIIISVKDKTVTLRSGDSKLEVSKPSVAEVLERDAATEA